MCSSHGNGKTGLEPQNTGSCIKAALRGDPHRWHHSTRKIWGRVPRRDIKGATAVSMCKADTAAPWSARQAVSCLSADTGLEQHILTWTPTVIAHTLVPFGKEHRAANHLVSWGQTYLACDKTALLGLSLLSWLHLHLALTDWATHWTESLKKNKTQKTVFAEADWQPDSR